MRIKRLHDHKNDIALVKHGTEILMGYLHVLMFLTESAKSFFNHHQDNSKY